MQILPILLVAVVMAANEGLNFSAQQWGMSGWWVAALAIVPCCVVLLIQQAATDACLRRAASGRGDVAAWFGRAERASRAARMAMLGVHAAAVLGLGWLDVVRSVTGNLILVDELIVLTPPLTAVAFTWWVHYPVERRLHDALLMRRLDDGRPIFEPPTRIRYVLLQLRLHILLMLVPILLIVALGEIIRMACDSWTVTEESPWIEELLTIVAAASVFVGSPLIARVLLDVRPLAPGPLRDGLLGICRRHRVRIRQLLVWNTHGSMINAAVMGLVGRLRYVLMTDALLETLPESQVRAVMAHEIGHVRRHHMPWLVAILLAVLILTGLCADLLLMLAIDPAWVDTEQSATAAGLGVTALELAIALPAFGWVCRRFERQADTFAVQHLSGMGDGPAIETAPPAQDRHVTSEAVQSMWNALQTISRLNIVDRHRPSWRHGSIAWRQNYLDSIIGMPVHRLPIDRLIRRIKAATTLVLLGGLALALWQWTHAPIDDTTRPLHGQAVETSIDRRIPSDLVGTDGASLREASRDRIGPITPRSQVQHA